MLNYNWPAGRQKVREHDYDLEDRLVEYGAMVIGLTERMGNSRAGNHLAGQLLRSGTSPLLNHGEAEAAESINDFIHKLSICLKELKESHRSLRLTKRARLINDTRELEQVLAETKELILIFSAAIRTSKKRRDK
jgi:four helix bundle protein